MFLFLLLLLPLFICVAVIQGRGGGGERGRGTTTEQIFRGLATYFMKRVTHIKSERKKKNFGGPQEEVQLKDEK